VQPKLPRFHPEGQAHQLRKIHRRNPHGSPLFLNLVAIGVEVELAERADGGDYIRAAPERARL